MLNRRFAVIAACLLGSACGVGSAQAQFARDRACYGDSVEVILVDSQGTPRVPLHVPIDAAPSLTTYVPPGESRTYSEACMPEPILAESVYFYPAHHASPALGIGVPGPTVRRFQVRYGRGSSEASDKLLRARIRQLRPQGARSIMPNGFFKLLPTPSEAGEFIAPEPYTEPFGEPLLVQCAPMVSSTECQVLYEVEGDMLLDYWFMTDETDASRWLDLDRLMRRVASGLIDRDHLARWHRARPEANRAAFGR